MKFGLNNEKIYIKGFEYENLEDIWPTVSQLQELNLQKIPDFTKFNITDYLNIQVTNINSKYKRLDCCQKYLLTIFLNVFLANYHRMKDKESVNQSCDACSFEDNINESDGQNSDLTSDSQNSDLTSDDQNTDSITDDQNCNLTTDDQYSDSIKNENGDSTIKNENSDLITNDTQYTKYNCKINPNNLKIEKQN